MTCQSRAAPGTISDLVTVLRRARNRAHTFDTLNQVLGRERHLNLPRTLDRAVDSARAINGALNFAGERDLDHALDQAHALSRAIERGIALARTPDLDSAFALAEDLSHALDFDLAVEVGEPVVLGPARDDVAELQDLYFGRESDQDVAADLAQDVAIPVVALAARVDGSRYREEIAPLAGRLAGAAARLLPAADRDRYTQEFRSELWEQANAGQPRRRQAAYAMRQLVRAKYLRAELTASSLRRASP